MLFLKGLQPAKPVLRDYDGEVVGLRDRTISGTSSPALKAVKFAKLFPVVQALF